MRFLRRRRRSTLFGPSLRGAQWGVREARRRRRRRLVAGAAVVGVAASGSGAWALWFRADHDEPRVVGKPGPRCPTARLPGRLGTVAWVRDGRLFSIGLDTCKHRTLVRRRVAPPVRFSPDGRRVAFGAGLAVSVDGGTAEPMFDAASWSWLPRGRALVGIDQANGRVVRAESEDEARALSRHGADSLTVSPSGDRIAFDQGSRVVVLPSEGGGSIIPYVTSTGARLTVAGWSPDGQWVLFWAGLPGDPTPSLNATPVVGGGYYNIFDPVLAYGDFLSWCGRTLVVSGGGEALPSLGQQLLVSEPPAWNTRNLSEDFRSSWIWPACSPDGRWIAVVKTPNQDEEPPGEGRRALWLVSSDGERRIRLAGGSAFAYEAPRWSADGRFVMVARRHLPRSSSGQLVLIRIDRKTGKPLKTVLVADLGPATFDPATPGHPDWFDRFDWYRPG